MEKNSEYNIELKQILTGVKNHFVGLLVTFAVSMIIGIIIAFSIPKSYTTEVKLAPESTTNSNIGGSLSSLASMFGANSSQLNNDAIYPELYPEVVSSPGFLQKLFNIKVTSIDKKISTTLFDYMANRQKSPWWVIKDSETIKEGKVNPKCYTKDQWRVIESLKNIISCDVDEENSVITIKATAQDALISTTIADSVSQALQEFITKYRTEKAIHDLKYMEKLYVESKRKYEKARRKYGSYADANTDVILESYKSLQEDLENEMQLQYNTYTQISQQLQTARAKVLERTPVYTTIQEATVPYRKSAPKRIFIVAICIFIGMGIYSLYLIAKDFLNKK